MGKASQAKKAGAGESSKEKLKKWLKAKKESKSAEGKGKGKGNDRGKGKDVSKGDGKGKRGKEASQEQRSPKPSLLELGAKVSDDLVRKLMATKQKLLAGNAEAARAGAVRAEPGAWLAEKDQKAKSEDASSSREVKGKSKGKGKNKSKVPKWQQRQAELEKLQPEVPVIREELVALNRRIAAHAQERDLAGARATLEKLEGKRWANGHTYAAAVNAFCRCGDWQSAEAALARAEAAKVFRGHQGAPSGVITRTSMLRGYVECARDLSKARALLEKMEKELFVAAKPNVRTANTFLRGCLILGAVTDAENLLKRMESKWASHEEWHEKYGGAPDSSSYETVVNLLCQALRHDEAAALAKKAIDSLGTSPGCAAMFVAVARTAAVSGNPGAAAAASKRARQLLQQEANWKSDQLSTVTGSGGKRGTVKKSAASSREEYERQESGGPDAARQRSLEVFQSHRRSELQSELRDLENFVGATASASSSQASKKRKRAEGKPVSGQPKIDLGSLWARTLSFEDYGDEATSSLQESMANALVRRICAKFGMKPESPEALTAAEKFTAAISGGQSSSKKKKRRKGSAEASEPRLNLAALFESGGEAPAKQSVRLELCSGGLEWLCSQALREPKAAWVGCELRFDRVARGFQRLALHGLARADGNAGMIVGDARDALSNRLLPGSCSRLFINHPEPPHQTDLEKAAKTAETSGLGSSGTEATHLLTVPFLESACGAVLQAGGILTVCTDNEDYGKWLMQAFAKEPLRGLFEDALHGSKEDKVGRVGREGKVGLRSEPPPEELCGACYSGEDGASYFQRLKKSEKGSRGQEDKRYFLCLKRLEG